MLPYSAEEKEIVFAGKENPASVVSLIVYMIDEAFLKNHIG
jgi:hypothetical protein